MNIEDSRFEGGTTLHVSTPDIWLETWFEQDNHFQRVVKTFSPDHSEQELAGNVGEDLGSATGVAGAIADATAEHARSKGMVGHAQKAAGARDEDSTSPLLQRVSTRSTTTAPASTSSPASGVSTTSSGFGKR